MNKITINDTTVIEGRDGQSVFSVLSQAGIFIPSACGGKGRCGLCKAIIHGVDQHTEAELTHFKPEEQADGWHLCCQVIPSTPLSVQLPEDQLTAKPIKATVSAIRNLTADIKEIEFSTPTEFTFKAGQFLSVRIPAYGGASLPVFRTYSMANGPAEKNVIRFNVRLVPNGYGSTYMHQHLKPGDSVFLVGPYGQFYLRDSEADILMIAGGSGMAPMRSILDDLAHKKSQRSIRFYFGARNESELFYLDLMKEYEQKLPNFKFIPCLNEGNDHWHEHIGLAPLIAADELSAEKGTRTEAYLCGSAGMINASIDALKAKNITDDRIFYDRF